MPQKRESESRKLLGRLRDAMAEDGDGQQRLDKITELIAGYADGSLLDLPVSRQ